MKRIAIPTVAALAAATLFDLAPAKAADLRERREPIAAAIAVPADLWTGFYVGAHVGFRADRNRVNYTLDGFTQSSDASTAVGGLHMGYNWLVTPNFLFGLEAAGSYGEASTTFDSVYRVRSTWDAQFRARLGYVQGPWLLYAAGGLAVMDQRVTDLDFGTEVTKTRTGWTVGAGVEYAFDPSWRLRGEYLYSDFGNSTYSLLDQLRVRSDTHTVRLGVSYRFATGGWPLSSRY